MTRQQGYTLGMSILFQPHEWNELGPLLFTVVLHPRIHEINKNYKILLHAWHIDDGTITGDSVEVTKTLDIIQEIGSGLGLELNIHKTKTFWPSCNGSKLYGVSFIHWKNDVGVKLLRGTVSRNGGFIEGLSMKRAAKVVELMHLLLQSCSISKLFFGLRTRQPNHMEKSTISFDKELSRKVEDIMIGKCFFSGDLQ